MDQAETPQASFDPERLVIDHQAGVWRYLRTLGCEPALADDITQETFLAVLQKPPQVFNAAATAGYLRTVARNLFITHRRRSGRVYLTENIDQLDVFWTEWVRDDTGDDVLAALQDCFQLLTDRAKLALQMRFRTKSTRAAIAAELDISEHGAKNLMQRAKKQLRECIELKVSNDTKDDG